MWLIVPPFNVPEIRDLRFPHASNTILVLLNLLPVSQVYASLHPCIILLLLLDPSFQNCSAETLQDHTNLSSLAPGLHVPSGCHHPRIELSLQNTNKILFLQKMLQWISAAQVTDHILWGYGVLACSSLSL